MTRMRTYVALFVITAVSALAVPAIATFSAAGSSTVTNGTENGPTQGLADLVAIKTSGLPPSEAWTEQFGTSNNDRAHAIAIDAAGNSYVAGYTFGTFQGQIFLGNQDAFVRKYDAFGNMVWTRQFGTTTVDIATSIAVDAAGNSYVAGITSAALPGQNSFGGQDAFVRKYDAAGNEVWTRQFGSSSSDQARGIAVDSVGNSYVAGSTLGTLPGQTTVTNSEAFVRKYDATGSEVWTRQFGTSDFDDEALGIAVDAAGNSYVAGHTFGTLQGQTNSAGSADAFIRKYDPTGNEVWTRQFGSSHFDSVRSIAVNAVGHIFVAGRTAGTLPGQSSSGDSDAFVRKFDSAGNDVWTRQFGSNALDDAQGIGVNAAGDSYVTGYTEGTFPDQTSSGALDAFVRKYDAGGNAVWTRQFGTSANDQAYAIAVDVYGNSHVAGYAVGTLPGQTTAGGSDAFVRKYSGGETTCNPWTWTITTVNQGGSGASFTSGQTIVLDNLPSGLTYEAPQIANFSGITGSGSISASITGDTLTVLAVGNVTIGAGGSFSVSLAVTPTAGGTYNNPRSGGTAVVDPNNVVAESNEANNTFTDSVNFTACATPSPTPATVDLAAFKTSDLPAGNEVWTRQFGTNSLDEASSIAVDAAGNSYVAGTTLGTFPGETKSGSYDVFVRKYDSGGNAVWTRQFGTSSSDFANAIAVDAVGNSYVVGRSDGTFPGQTNAGDYDAYVRKYDTAGNEVWTRQFGASGRDEAHGIAADAAGNVYVAGRTEGTLPGQTNSGGNDAFVRKYDAAGGEVWTRQFGTSGWDEAHGIAVDDTGNSYIAGFTVGSLPGQSNAGSSDAFVRKYGPTGNEIWTRQFGSGGGDYAWAVAGDAEGNSYVAGYTLDILPGQSSAGGRDAFLRKYDAAGTEVWTRQFGTSGLESAEGIAVDAAGNSYLSGYTTGTLPGQTSSVGYDAYVRKYNALGTEIWTRQFGTNRRDEAHGIAVDIDGNIFVTGGTPGTLPGQTTSGAEDAFVRKYSTDATSCTAWTWTIKTSNQGGTNALFASGQTIVLDDLPSSGLTYGTPVAGNFSGITGNISATIIGNTLRVTAADAFAIAPGGSFTVSFTTTPKADGGYHNPRNGGMAMVDPSNVIDEANEANNSFFESVLVIGCPTLSFVTVSGQVTTPDGRGLRGATVSIVDDQGNRRTAVTSTVGYYSFDQIESGGTLLIAVASKRFRFAPRTLEVNASLSNVDFVGVE